MLTYKNREKETLTTQNKKTSHVFKWVRIKLSRHLPKAEHTSKS